MSFRSLDRDGMIIRTAPLGVIATNTYVVGCANTLQGAIVDSVAEADAIDAMVQSGPALQIAALWQTHAHIDHVAALGATKALYKAPIWVHPDEMPLYQMAPAQGQMLGIRCDPLPAPDESFAEGQTVRLGDLEGKIIHTPGHTPGGVCLYFEAQKVVFCGDMLFAGSIGRTDLPGGHTPTMFKSLARMIELPDDTLVLNGHGPETTIGREKGSNPFLRMI